MPRSSINRLLSLTQPEYLTNGHTGRAVELIYASHLKLYSWIVAQRGWKAATALVGSTKVSFPDSAAIDVILLDYRLASELKATDVAQLLKQAYPFAPAIVLSEMPWMPDEMRGHAAAFVHKGEPQRLLDTLEAIMHGRLPVEVDTSKPGDQ